MNVYITMPGKDEHDLSMLMQMVMWPCHHITSRNSGLQAFGRYLQL